LRGLLIKNARLVQPDGIRTGLEVLCRDGRIVLVAAGPADARGAEVVDAGGAYLGPGLIDLHIHGCRQWLIDRGAEDLAAVAEALPQYGVTGFLPTVGPLPPGQDAPFLAALAAARPRGAEILGFHLEGPFLALTGALPPGKGVRNLFSPLTDPQPDGRPRANGEPEKVPDPFSDAERAKALIDAARPHRAIFSISPDFEDIERLLPVMTAGGVPAFITHTRATVAQTRRAIELGARHATHFYDVFPSPPETEPGVRPCGAVEAVLADERVSVDFILDGVHVDPAAVRVALQCKGPDRVCLITDANVGAGLPAGRYCLADGEEIAFARQGAPARLTRRSRFPGALAGSGLTMDQAVRNAVKMLGLDVPTAVRLAGLNPARVLGLERSKGRIAPGYDADLVLLDEELHVLRTWVGGQTRYLARPPAEGR